MVKQAASKPFPWKCFRCRLKTVTPAIVSYSTNIEHDGRLYKVNVPDLEVPRCEKCGEMVLTDAANRRISDSFRAQLGLLTPQEIRKHRESLELTQKQLALRLGIAEATLSRWETGGQIQQRALDRLLRLFFWLPDVRSTLSADGAVIDIAANGHRDTAGKAPTGSNGGSEKALRLSRLAAALGELPKDKESQVIEQFHRLLELMQPE